MKLKKAVFILIILLLCGCSYLLSESEIGLAKKYPSNISLKPNIKATFSTELMQSPDVTPEATIPKNEGSVFIHYGPGNVNVPILLYHHILQGKPTNLYSVSAENFQEQLKYLKNSGYHTIALSQLIQAISVGIDLPEKPILISFDDGNENVYLNAFPLMKIYGFIGEVYIIGNRINVDGFLSKDQLKELISSGWEIGSHGMKHIDLVQNPGALREEIGISKKKIEDLLNIKVISFAYPFGKATKITMDWVKQVGYLAGMGLGIINQNGKENIFYLNRRQVESNIPLQDFIELISIN
jgi:peptidoglycan/xylan/chitin deacetylase (PgdA/CDA1 family)